jgi:WD40 repeat protein
MVGGDSQQATVLTTDQLHDLAVLVCLEPFSESVPGLVPTSSVPPGSAIAVTGVAQIEGDQRFRYASTTGTWQGLAVREDSVTLGQAVSAGLARGMAGAPVRRSTDGFVIGVVSARYNSPDGWLRDTFWLARTEELESLLTRVPLRSGSSAQQGSARNAVPDEAFTILREMQSSGPLTAVAMYEGSESALLITGSEAHTVDVWDLGLSQSSVQQLVGHDGPVWAVAVGSVADRPIIASAGQDQTVRVWDPASSLEVSSPLIGHTGPINAVALGYLADHAVALTASDDMTVRVWDIVTGTAVGEPVTVHSGWVNAVATAPLDDQRLVAVSGSSDMTVRVWDVPSGQPLETFDGHTDSVSSVAVAVSSTNELVVVSGSNDETVRVWGAGGEVRHVLAGHKGRVRTVAIGTVRGEQSIVSGGDDGTVRVWSLADPRSRPHILRGHVGPVRAVAVGVLNGRSVIVSAGDDGVLKIWQAAGAGGSDQVDWLSDAPAAVDLLQRVPLAQAVGTRLRRVHGQQPNSSFLVHIDGPWGAGKTTLLGFLRASLEHDWITVDFNAWRESAAGPPWWALLAALRRDIQRGLKSPASIRLRFADTWARLRRSGAPFILASTALLVFAAAVILLLGPSKWTSASAGDLAKSVSAVITALGTLWAGSLVAAKFLLWNSARGARLFEQSGSDPMQSIRAHFAWFSWSTISIGAPNSTLLTYWRRFRLWCATRPETLGAVDGLLRPVSWSQLTGRGSARATKSHTVNSRTTWPNQGDRSAICSSTNSFSYAFRCRRSTVSGRPPTCENSCE